MADRPVKKDMQRRVPELQQRAPSGKQPGGIVFEVAEDGSSRWPQGAPLPVRWLVRSAYPCPSCLAVCLPGGYRAVHCAGHRSGKAHLRCRACGHTWTLAL